MMIAGSVGACGSITRGTTEPITFVSEPSGASMKTNMQYACAATPCTLEVERSDEFVATFTKPGYQPQSIPVKTKIVTKGAAGFAGNLLAGGVIGMGVDAYTGAAMDHEPNPVIARLRPAGGLRRGPAANGPGM
ncbi:translation initiation factor 2 [Methylobacterium nonmethylotrophicum]|uniref:Translation initiation factor 2 n=2 Tax=Methylobacterium nonmethylotrophicum TaxID=1141884 RepID=A0A4Z0NML1_9HYPH|nr:translation initiation factor 2 [Methylobacterium nonmethylotrophicum]